MFRNFAAFMCILLVLTLAACNAVGIQPTPTSQKTSLTFTYWGSDVEKAAIGIDGRGF